MRACINDRFHTIISTNVSHYFHIAVIWFTCCAVILHLTDKDAEAVFWAATHAEAELAIHTLIHCDRVDVLAVITTLNYDMVGVSLILVTNSLLVEASVCNYASNVNVWSDISMLSKTSLHDGTAVSDVSQPFKPSKGPRLVLLWWVVMFNVLKNKLYSSYTSIFLKFFLEVLMYFFTCDILIGFQSLALLGSFKLNNEKWKIITCSIYSAYVACGTRGNNLL